MTIFERLRLFAALPVFAAEGAGGGGGEGDGDGAGGGEGGAPDPDPAPDPVDAWTPPEHVPEQFRGETAEDTLEKLAAGWKGLRDKLAGLPQPPKSPDGYTFEPAEAIRPWFPDPAAHPGLQAARAAFHRHGVPAEAFGGIVNEVYTSLAEAGQLAPAYDPQAEVARFGEAFGLDKAELGAALETADAFARGLAGQLAGDLPEALRVDAEAQLVALTDTAAGNAVLRALAERLNDTALKVPAGEGALDRALTRDELRALAADPRIDPANRDATDPNVRYDEALRKRYDEAHARLGRGTAG